MVPVKPSTFAAVLQSLISHLKKREVLEVTMKAAPKAIVATRKNMARWYARPVTFPTLDMLLAGYVDRAAGLAVCL